MCLMHGSQIEGQHMHILYQVTFLNVYDKVKLMYIHV